MGLINRVSSKLFSWTDGGPVRAVIVDLKKSANSIPNGFVKLAAETATITYLEGVRSFHLSPRRDALNLTFHQLLY